MKTYFNVKRYQPKTKEKLFLKLKDLKIDYNLFYSYFTNMHYVRLNNDLEAFRSEFQALRYLDSVVYKVVKDKSSVIMKDFYTKDRYYNLY